MEISSSMNVSIDGFSHEMQCLVPLSSNHPQSSNLYKPQLTPLSMSFKAEFALPTKCELKNRNSFKWTLSEGKILQLNEVRKLRLASLKMKEEGMRTKEFFKVRDAFMIELGLHSGLRLMEMCALKIEDLLIDGSRSSVVVRHGKGDKMRNVWIGSKLKGECLDYLKRRIEFGLANDPCSPVLCTESGNSISRRAIQKAFKRCLTAAGIVARKGIHSLRHTYATFLLKSSKNLKLVQQQLGHSSIKTTEIYITLLKDDTQRALESLYQEGR